MLHLCKLSVGVRDIAHLRELQARRMANDPPLRHHTRNHPRRADEITQGGSIYWVIAGVMCVRQRVVEIIADTWDDGSACAGLVLDPTLVPVLARRIKAFQGWRYLAAADAPADITETDVASDALPATLVRDLKELCLL